MLYFIFLILLSKKLWCDVSALNGPTSYETLEQMFYFYLIELHEWITFLLENVVCRLKRK